MRQYERRPPKPLEAIRVDESNREELAGLAGIRPVQAGHYVVDVPGGSVVASPGVYLIATGDHGIWRIVEGAAFEEGYQEVTV